MQDHTIMGLLLIAFYFLPGIVAAMRHHPNQTAIFILNLLLGWTILGWIAALVWSISHVAPSDRVESGLLFGPYWKPRRDDPQRDPRWADLRSE